MNYQLKIIKFNTATGLKDELVISLTKLNEIMTPAEVFGMEFKLNELPKFRFHIEAK